MTLGFDSQEYFIHRVTTRMDGAQFGDKCLLVLSNFDINIHNICRGNLLLLLAERALSHLSIKTLL